MLSFCSYSLGQIRLVETFIFEHKINNSSTIIIESFACVLKIFFMIFLLPMNFLNSFRICSTLKLSKYVILLSFTYKAMQGVAIAKYSSIYQCDSFFILGKLFLV